MFRHAIVLAAFIACGTSAIADPSYISFQVPGATFTEPRAINSAGDVTGSYLDEGYASHGFVRLHDGTIQTFDFDAPHSGIQPTRINDRGEIAGVVFDTRNDDARGFLRSPDGTIKAFKVPGTEALEITGLNNKGAVTGSKYDNSSSTTHGFVRKAGGALQMFDIPEATRTGRSAINDNGTVAGVYFLDDFPYRGFIRDRTGAITTFDPPRDSFFNVVAISNAGVIAGNMLFDGGFVRAPNGTFTIFTVKHYSTFVQDMNADGAITGTYVSGQNQRTHGFLRTPDGTITTFDYPTVNHYTYPVAINDSGVITGDYIGDGGIFGFVRFP